MECKSEKNKMHCYCTYNCPQKGICCECIAYHRQYNELPACYFTEETEKTYDRSIEAFIKQYEAKHVG